MAAPSRTRAYRRGLAGETRAVLALMIKGYRIVARRARTGVGEIDIVAVRGSTVAIVEVKARADLASALEAVGPATQARLVRAAAAWLPRHPSYRDHTIRFDIMVVRPCRWPTHIVNAFEARS